MTETVSEIRKRAWKTRRKKYGERGHAGDYSGRGSGALSIAREMLARLHNDGVLPEGQAAKACSLDRIRFRRLCDRLANESS